jgi:streptogrisin D
MTDPKTDQVVVAVDSTVTGARLGKIEKAASAQGAAVRIGHVSGKGLS